MGTVNISAMYVKDNSGIQTGNLPVLQTEDVTSSGTSAQSSAMPVGTEVVRICSDTNIRIAIGSNPTATTSSLKVIAEVPEYFTIKEGLLVAVING